MLTVIIIFAPIILMVCFIYTYRQNKLSLIPSYLSSLATLAMATSSAYYLYPLATDHGSLIARIFLLLILIPFILVVSFGIYALIIMFFINARTVFKKESRSLAHALTFIIAVLMMGYLVVARFVNMIEIPDYLDIFVSAIYFLIAFYGIHILQYVIATTLCNLSKPYLNQDYIIVHGSGLINGKVSPLLAGRIDVAIKFYHNQKKVAHPPKLILSGGQGHDEPRAEAVAMKEYALNQRIPATDILVEDKSTTTLENMQFSKKIMALHSAEKPYNCIYATSNYHLFRTGIYGKMVGLNMDGIGSKTARYYLPNALIREYIAYVMMYKKRHLLFILFTCLVALIFSIMSFITT